MRSLAMRPLLASLLGLVVAIPAMAGDEPLAPCLERTLAQRERVRFALATGGEPAERSFPAGDLSAPADFVIVGLQISSDALRRHAAEKAGPAPQVRHLEPPHRIRPRRTSRRRVAAVHRHQSPRSPLPHQRDRWPRWGCHRSVEHRWGGSAYAEGGRGVRSATADTHAGFDRSRCRDHAAKARLRGHRKIRSQIRDRVGTATVSGAPQDRPGWQMRSDDVEGSGLVRPATESRMNREI